MDTMLVFNVSSEKNAVRAIFDYCHLNCLTNPECSFVSNSTGLNMSDTYGSAQKQIPKTYNEFYNKIQKKSWDVCLCVAGTDARDSRRVVLTYMKEMKKVIVNFASAANGMSSNEKNISEWLSVNFNAI